jgi:PhzF family phenazine biosynthesis protein
MQSALYHVDAFASKPFEGNPAAVCPLNGWLDDGWLQQVAAENNLSETAFFVPASGHYELRWFTPRSEAKLCGHATLAAAFVVLNILTPQEDSVRFETRRSGALTVSRRGDLFSMDFPTLAPWACASPPSALIEGLGKAPDEVVQIEDDFFAVYESQEEVQRIRPDFRLLETLHPAGVAITAPGENSDFVSRFFAPSYGIPEDPVTGSIHCSLAPYWAARLGKSRLHARQISERGGELWCEVQGERINLQGNAVLTLQGEFRI